MEGGAAAVGAGAGGLLVRAAEGASELAMAAESNAEAGSETEAEVRAGLASGRRLVVQK